MLETAMSRETLHQCVSSGVGRSVSNDVSTRSTYSCHVPIMHEKVDEARDQRIVSAPFNSLFSKLSHPFESLLKRLRRVDGLDVNQLLVFFEDVIIRNICPLPDIQVFQIISPYCEDALGSKVFTAIRNRWIFKQFHRDC
jgi:hypothetical protein